MNIALCYENVLPARGGCETYIVDLTRRLTADGHEVHLYARRWDESALSKQVIRHRLDVPQRPRFLRPWFFGRACQQALAVARHDVSIGFDKTWGQDVLYPQGGLHSASAEHNLRKYPDGFSRTLTRLLKRFDPAAISFARLERKQYLEHSPVIIVNSEMVRRHFGEHYGLASEKIRVVHAAIHPDRFRTEERKAIRRDWRSRWQVNLDMPVALFVAMNYRLKGLEPLLHAVARVWNDFRLVVIGDSRTGRYERLARKLGIAERVIFQGYCGDMRQAYFAADVLVHPTFYDPCSLVVLEALACGLPVITSRYNGAAELLTPEMAGLVIDDPHDHVLLAQCIETMLETDYRQAAAEAANEAARRWNFEHHYRKIIGILTEVARRKTQAIGSRAA
ncbi:MAG TPA: glycosyltransferase family 4 protein [Gemmataceae bacterium]|jgi:UDP-glucose:(heptosyl)LPS alpha-1,3-glucosyltransferase|nr:glycosyltransferase family 4 protein [Gemmataceae bacterium]